MNEPSPAADRIRLDKWLWHARVVKTRTLAQKLIAAGNVRVDSDRITQTAYKVGPGHVLTISVANTVRVLRILAPGTRRGPASEAATLYEDLTPPQKSSRETRTMPVAPREPGAGRPTKKERRETDRLRKGD